MKKVININFQGQVIAIEETAYEILKQYIDSLKKYFSREQGGEEIVNDIESRIAELFGNRLKLGINCITDEDVESIIANIGRPEDFDNEYRQNELDNEAEDETNGDTNDRQFKNEKSTDEGRQSLYLNTNDKIIAGVCSGLAHYFKIDPVWIRIIFVLFFSILFWVYIVLWIILKPKALESNISKRLYRNTKDRIIGGVCSGIAAYFKIDAWIPRLIFIAPLILNFTGILTFPFFPFNKIFHNFDFDWGFNIPVVLIYIVLLIIIPRAETVKQKIEMAGEEEYIKSIRKTVSGNVAGTKAKNENEKSKTVSNSEMGMVNNSKMPISQSMPPEPPPQIPKITSSHNSSKQERSGCLNVITVLIKIIFFAFAGILVISLAGMLIAMLVAGIEFAPFKDMFINREYENTMLWVSLFLIFAIPVISFLIWIIRRSMGAKSLPVIGITSSILWTIGFFMLLTLGLKIAEKFKVDTTSEKVVALSEFNGDKLYVDMVDHPDNYYKSNHYFFRNFDIDELPYYSENEDSLLFSNIKVKITHSHNSLYYIRTIATCSEKNFKKARKNIEEFIYQYNQQDSLLLLPQFFSVPISQGYRAQEMVVEIEVPSGKKIEIDKKLDVYDNRSTRRNIE